jgi:SAM-dependent methyltransferase
MSTEYSGGQAVDLSYSDHAFVAEFYDHVVPYRDRADIGFYLEEAKLLGGPVLELGCGTGRVLIPIARAGIEITGVDLSVNMLEICRQRLESEPGEVQSRVTLVNEDMRVVDPGGQYMLVTSPFRAFQHLLSVEAQIQTLKNAFDILLPGGHLVMDVFNPSLHALTANNIGEEFGEEPEFKLPDGRYVERTHRIVERDHINQISAVELIYKVTHQDGQQERLVHAFKMRHLFRYELEHLLVRCGFELESVYCDFNRRPYGAIYPGELIVVAVKPAEVCVR